MLIVIQCLTILYGIFLAMLNEVPANKMICYGASIKEERQFHTSNAIVKIIWALTMALLLKNMTMILLLLLIQWLIFDIALGWMLHNDPLFIGTTAKTDKLLRKVFGDHAGLCKLLIVGVVILVINFFL